MTLYHAIGDVGSGKTLWTTWLAKHESRSVYSNYKIKIPNYHPLKPETLNTIEEPALIIVDEAYRWLESRTSGRVINRYMSYKIFQSRKKERDYALTDQLEETVDVRYRLMTNFEIHCHHIIDIGFQYVIFKNSAFKAYRPVSVIMPYSEAEKLYPLFDSWEEQPIDEGMIFNITEDKGEILKNVDEIVDFLLEKGDVKSYSKGDVSDYCLRHGYPKEYVQITYNALKVRRFDQVPFSELGNVLKGSPIPKDENPKRYRLRP
jgi:hypothetical protein